MYVCVCVETKSCLPFYIGSEMFLQSINKIKGMSLVILQGLLSAVQWCRLWCTLNFSCRESSFCFGESSSFLQEEWMEYCAFGAGMSNPHLWVFCYYNCLFSEGNNVPFPLPSEFPGQCCSSCSPATAASSLLPLHSPAFSMGKESRSSFRKLGIQLIRILAAWTKLVI